MSDAARGGSRKMTKSERKKVNILEERERDKERSHLAGRGGNCAGVEMIEAR
jgi:hypothetical protein